MEDPNHPTKVGDPRKDVNSKKRNRLALKAGTKFSFLNHAKLKMQNRTLMNGEVYFGNVKADVGINASPARLKVFASNFVSSPAKEKATFRNAKALNVNKELKAGMDEFRNVMHEIGENNLQKFRVSANEVFCEGKNKDLDIDMNKEYKLNMSKEFDAYNRNKFNACWRKSFVDSMRPEFDAYKNKCDDGWSNTSENDIRAKLVADIRKDFKPDVNKVFEPKITENDSSINREFLDRMKEFEDRINEYFDECMKEVESGLNEFNVEMKKELVAGKMESDAMYKGFGNDMKAEFEAGMNREFADGFNYGNDTVKGKNEFDDGKKQKNSTSISEFDVDTNKEFSAGLNNFDDTNKEFTASEETVFTVRNKKSDANTNKNIENVTTKFDGDVTVNKEFKAGNKTGMKDICVGTNEFDSGVNKNFKFGMNDKVETCVETKLESATNMTESASDMINEAFSPGMKTEFEVEMNKEYRTDANEKCEFDMDKECETKMNKEYDIEMKEKCIDAQRDASSKVFYDALNAFHSHLNQKFISNLKKSFFDNSAIISDNYMDSETPASMMDIDDSMSKKNVTDTYLNNESVISFDDELKASTPESDAGRVSTEPGMISPTVDTSESDAYKETTESDTISPTVDMSQSDAGRTTTESSTISSNLDKSQSSIASDQMEISQLSTDESFLFASKAKMDEGTFSEIPSKNRSKGIKNKINEVIGSESSCENKRARIDPDLELKENIIRSISVYLRNWIFGIFRYLFRQK